MIPIKIVCECGQRYAFDVEPVGGRMPSTVACPACGADGTAAANAVIAESIPAQPAIAVATTAPLRIGGTSYSHQPAIMPASPRLAPARILLPGQVDQTQAVHEAKAKISWGDPPNAVAQYLMMQGFDYAEATELVNGMFRERAITIRRNGIGKLIVGSVLVCVPIVSLFIFLSMKFIPMKLFAGTIMIGLWGAYMVMKGMFMVIAPKAEPGDVAEH